MRAVPIGISRSRWAGRVTVATLKIRPRHTRRALLDQARDPARLPSLSLPRAAPAPLPPRYLSICPKVAHMQVKQWDRCPICICPTLSYLSHWAMRQPPPRRLVHSVAARVPTVAPVCDKSGR